MVGYPDELFQRRQLVIPFDQGGERAQSGHSIVVKLPDRGANGLIVAIEQVTTKVGMTREMILDYALGRDGIDIAVRVEAVVEGVDVDVVDVKQNGAVGFFRYRTHKVPLLQLAATPAQVAGDVFQRDWLLQNVLNFANPARDMRDHLTVVGERQQVVEIVPASAGPT